MAWLRCGLLRSLLDSLAVNKNRNHHVITRDAFVRPSFWTNYSVCISQSRSPLSVQEVSKAYFGEESSMRVPLLDFEFQHAPLRDQFIEEFKGVLDTGRFILGPKVDELESVSAEYLGSKFALGVSSGTDALLLALMALDIRPGDIVVTTPYSFFATAGVISRLGAVPAFVDIDRDTYNISVDSLRKYLEDPSTEVSQVKCIMPVHLFGQSADMDGVVHLAKKYRIPIIEDAAQAIGTKFKNDAGSHMAGTIGEFGCFSFFPSKNLGCFGEAGLVVTDDPQLADKARLLRTHGSKPKYYHSMIGGNFRIDALQAAMLLVKFPHLEKWHEMRRENGKFYDEALSSVSEVTIPKLSYPRECHIYNQYVIQANERNELQAFLTSKNIGTEIYYPVPFHLQKCFKDLGYKEGDFPNSEYAANHSLALPIYPGLTLQMQEYVVDSIKQYRAAAENSPPVAETC